MKALCAIIKLTWRHTVRSHIFQLLLLILAACVAVVPTTVGAGNATDFIRVSLLYSLSGVAGVLSLSIVWVSCFIMAHDIDNYELHMVVSKPVSRITIWLAKCTGVATLHILLLLIASMSIYGIIIYRFNNFKPEDFPAGSRAKIALERERIRNEVMVGRRVFMPYTPDFMELAKEQVRKNAKLAEEKNLRLDLSPQSQEKMIKNAMKEVVAAASSVPAGATKIWEFNTLPADLDRPMYLRYCPYVGKVDTKEQRMTRVMWYIAIPRPVQDAARNDNVFNKSKSRYELMMYPLSQSAEQVMSGNFHEKTLRPEWKFITPDRKVFVSVANLDPDRGLHYYQPKDGPKLLIAVCGFFENYCRAVLVIALALLVLAGVSCAFGGFLTMPTAVFVVASYLMFGSFSLFLTDPDYYVAGAADKVGQFVAGILLAIVVPVQEFIVTDRVAGGELIEWSYIGYICWYYLLCRVLPLVLLGMFFYRRRELGLVLRSK